MATGTLARLVVAVGIDDSQMVSGIAKTRANVLSNLAQMGAQAETQVEKTAANITRSNSGTIAAMAKPALIGLTTLVAIGAGLGMLAVKFESETSHIAASAGVTADAANKIGTDFLNAAGKSQTMIFTAEDMTNSYAAVAGQLALTDSKVNVVRQDMTFMKAAVDLAAGSNEKLGDATTGVASILQNFGLHMKDSGLAANTLFDASRSLHMTIPQVTDVFEKLQGRAQGAGLTLQDVSTLVEDMASHSLTGQRNINLFSGAINQLLSGAASPAKVAQASDAVKTAQLNLAAAQIKLNQAETSGSGSAASHQLALERLQIAEEKLAAARASYPAMSKQVVEAELAVQSAEVAAGNAASSSSDKVALAKIALQKAQDAVTKAQLAANGMTGNANALLKHLGVTVYDSAGKFVGMRNVIGELHNAFATMTQEQQRAAATTLFGASAAGAMTAIINGGVVAWDKYANNVKKGETAHQGATAATKNLAAQWSLVVGQIQADATKLSIGLEPVISSMLSGLLKDLPTIEADATAAFHIIAGAVSFAWGVIGPILGFFGSHMQIVEGILALLVARWLIIKGLKIAEGIASWGEAAMKLVAPTGPLRSLESLLDIAKNGSIGKGLQDTKNAWNDTFSTGQLIKAQNLGTAVEDSAKRVQGFMSQLETAQLGQKLAPTSAGADLVKGWEDAITSARGELVGKVTDFLKDPAIQNALTGDLEKGITNPRVLTALNGVLSTASDAMGKDFGKSVGNAVTDALDNVGVSAGDKLTTNIASKLGGVLGKIGALAAQPVFIMGASPAYYAEMRLAGGGGLGGLPGDLGKLGGAGGAAGLLAEVGGAAGLGTILLTVLAGGGVMAAIFGLVALIDPQALHKNPLAAPGAGDKNLVNSLFADLSVGMGKNARGGKAGASAMAIAGENRQRNIIADLEKMGVSQANATKDAAIIEKAYLDGSIKTPAALATMLNDIVDGALGVKAAISAFSNKIYALANGINVNRTTSGYIPGLQGGGDVARGHLYIVGEHGPELFASNIAGSIIPFNHIAKTQTAMAGPNIPLPSVSGFTPVGAATGVRQAPVIGQVIVNNPKPEMASTSVEQELRQISYLGQM